MSVEQYLRAARVQLMVPGTGTLIIPEGDPFNSFHIAFKIDKYRFPPQPSCADIQVHNLKHEHRAMFTARDYGSTSAEVNLEVGYRGSVAGATPNYASIFHGGIRTVQHSKIGTDWVTRIQCADWERQWRYMTNLSFDKGSKVIDAIRAIAAATGLKQGNLNSLKLPGDPVFRKGHVFDSYALAHLKKLLGDYHYIFFVEEGVINVVSDKTVIDQRPVLISEESGMIGSPEFSPPDKSPRKSTMTVTCLLNPEITLKRNVQVKSRFNPHEHDFMPTAISHSGDTHSDNWITKVSLRPLG